MSVTLVLQAVVRVNDKTFYATPSDKKAGFFKNCVEPVIFLWADKEKVRDKDKRMIDEINERIESAEAELLELPPKMKEINEQLMILSMEYFYAKIKVNAQESKEIDAWIQQVRIDLKKNIIKKQNRDINNREIYAYLHDICGPQVLDLFDVEMEDSNRES